MESEFEGEVNRALTAGFHGYRDYEAYRQLLVRHDLMEQTRNAVPEVAPRDTLYGRLLADITCATRDHAIEAKIDGFDYDHLLSRARSIPYDLLGSTQHPNAQVQLNFWRHEHQPISRAKFEALPILDSYAITAATNAYLDLPLRSKELPRTLLELLVAERVFEKLRLLYGHPDSLLRRPHPFLEWLIGALSLSIFLGAITFTADAVSSSVGDIWSTIRDGGRWLWAGLFALGLINLPFFWRGQARERQAAEHSLAPYIRFYAELGEQPPWSANHLWQAAHAASEKGAAWPAALYRLLDDSNKRDGIL